MPTHKVPGGWKWGNHGKVYPTKEQADRQGKAIEMAEHLAKHAKEYSSKRKNNQ